MHYKVRKPFVRKGVTYEVDAEIDLPERDAVYLWMGGFLTPLFEAKPLEKPRRRSRLEVVAMVNAAEPKPPARRRGRPPKRNDIDDVDGEPSGSLPVRAEPGRSRS